MPRFCGHLRERCSRRTRGAFRQATTPVAGTEYDFREPRAIAATKLDHGFTDLERDEDGLARVELTNPASGVALALWVDESYPYLMLFTGDLPEVERRALAVEPMTCAPNAFRSGEGLIVLEPGGSVTSTWGISPTTGSGALRLLRRNG